MIIFASRTGNVRSIVNKLGLDNTEIKDGLIASSPFFIFTYTDGLGAVPKVVDDFMKYEDNWKYCKGVIASGNTNFGHHVFCGAGDKLSNLYDIPIIHKIELRGFEKDLEIITQKYNLIMKG